MGERTRHAPGTFSWTDLGTTDSAGAKAFYRGLFGWELEDLPLPDAPPYTMARIGGKAVCALYQRSAEQPRPQLADERLELVALRSVHLLPLP